MISLVGLITTSVILLFAQGTTMFWIFGLLLTLWVGPAQASSRSFLAQVAPEGREGEMFGLYATTGRAASFLAPGLFALFSGLFSDRIGIVGIALVLGHGSSGDDRGVGRRQDVRRRSPNTWCRPRSEHSPGAGSWTFRGIGIVRNCDGGFTNG